ncbi:MAG: Obg family GTPase CgtA, partial [Ruthenibacterium sp.]
QIEAFRAFIEGQNLVFLPVSAATRQGLDRLPGMVYERLQTLPPARMYEPEYIRPEVVAGDARTFTVTREDAHAWRVEAPFLVRILESSDVDDYESLQYFQKQLADSGVLDQLVEMGVEEDDTIRIDDYEFDYVF